ncbi:MAG: hypothetical protein HRU35_05535 [Rickettsiaceae bacterium]|nr:hypothetical protein [Rickettsiaceae bacterium]
MTMKIANRLVLGLLIGISLGKSSFAKPTESEAKHEGFVEFLCECKSNKDAAKCFAIALDELRYNKYMDAKTKMELHKKAIEELKKSLADIEEEKLVEF